MKKSRQTLVIQGKLFKEKNETFHFVKYFGIAFISYIFIQQNTYKIYYKKSFLNPISTGGGGYNVPHGYIFVENSWTANDFKLKFCDF